MQLQTTHLEFTSASAKPSSKSKRRKRPPPLSVRFSDEEKAALREKAGDKPLGRYIREMALSEIVLPRKKNQLFCAGEKAISRLTAKLGQSRISSNLNQIAKHANMGNLVEDDELIEDLNEACAHIAEIRSTLLKALGQRR